MPLNIILYLNFVNGLGHQSMSKQEFLYPFILRCNQLSFHSSALKPLMALTNHIIIHQPLGTASVRNWIMQIRDNWPSDLGFVNRPSTIISSSDNVLNIMHVLWPIFVLCLYMSNKWSGCREPYVLAHSLNKSPIGSLDSDCAK